MSNMKYIICAHQFEDEWNCGADINKIDIDSFDAIKKYLEDFEIFDPEDMESSNNSLDDMTPQEYEWIVNRIHNGQNCDVQGDSCSRSFKFVNIETINEYK